VLKTQLEAACKLYNTLLHAEQEEYEKNKHSMSRNELRQLALGLRKRSPEFQVLYSQAAQQVADRFHQARERFLDGLADKPKEKKPHKYLSLVYPQKGWRLSNTRQVGRGKDEKRREKARLHLNKIVFFTLVLHRDFPLERVAQVCVKMYPSGRVYVVFLVEETGTQQES
jgi:putative transposase